MAASVGRAVLQQGFHNPRFSDCVLVVRHRVPHVADVSDTGSLDETDALSGNGGDVCMTECRPSAPSCSSCRATMPAALQRYAPPEHYYLLRLVLCTASPALDATFSTHGPGEGAQFRSSVERRAYWTVESWVDHLAADAVLRHLHEERYPAPLHLPEELDAGSPAWYAVMRAVMLLANEWLLHDTWAEACRGTLQAGPMTVSGATILFTVPVVVWECYVHTEETTEAARAHRRLARKVLASMESTLDAAFLPLELGHASPAFVCLSAPAVQYVLQHPHAALDEGTVWQAAVRWVEAQMDAQREEKLDELPADPTWHTVLQCVRSEQCAPSYVSACVFPHRLFSRCPALTRTVWRSMRALVSDDAQRAVLQKEHQLRPPRDVVWARDLGEELLFRVTDVRVLSALQRGLSTARLSMRTRRYLTWTMPVRGADTSANLAWDGVLMRAHLYQQADKVELQLKARWNASGCDRLSDWHCRAMVVTLLGHNPAACTCSEVEWRRRGGAGHGHADGPAATTTWSMTVWNGSLLDLQLATPSVMDATQPDAPVPLRCYLVDLSDVPRHDSPDA